jgi:hypothetical protein
MPDRPVADELLTAARATLVADVLPAVPADLRYAVRMIVNAIAIAQREAAQPSPDGVLDAALADVLPATAGERPDVALAHAIRGGAFDADPAPLLRALRAWTAARLAVSNPKALAP